VKKKKVEFEKLEERVTPSAASVVVSSEKISEMLADMSDTPVIAVGSYDAWPSVGPILGVNAPAVGPAGLVAGGAAMAYAGYRTLRKEQEKEEEKG